MIVSISTEPQGTSVVGESVRACPRSLPRTLLPLLPVAAAAACSPAAPPRAAPRTVAPAPPESSTPALPPPGPPPDLAPCDVTHRAPCEARCDRGEPASCRTLAFIVGH